MLADVLAVGRRKTFVGDHEFQTPVGLALSFHGCERHRRWRVVYSRPGLVHGYDDQVRPRGKRFCHGRRSCRVTDGETLSKHSVLHLADHTELTAAILSTDESLATYAKLTRAFIVRHSGVEMVPFEECAPDDIVPVLTLHYGSHSYVADPRGTSIGRGPLLSASANSMDRVRFG